MNKKAILVYSGVLLSFLLASCASSQRRAPSRLGKEYDLNRQGNREFMKGGYAEAVVYYGEAVRLAKSVENHQGEAVNLINMAAAYRKMGDFESARACLDEVLNAGGSPGWSMAEACYQKALLYLDSTNLGPLACKNANFWAQRAFFYCSNDCEAEGRILNLKARIALALKDPSKASRDAQKALVLNKRNENLAEVANSLRLEAEADAMHGLYAGALRLYGVALAKDKGLALSRKMADDLWGMGNAWCAEKQSAKGIGYLDRALAITKVLGIQEMGKEISASIKECGK